MKNQTGELYFPPIRWYETGTNVLMMNDPSASGYDFLKGKTPQVIPDYWEEEDYSD